MSSQLKFRLREDQGQALLETCLAIATIGGALLWGLSHGMGQWGPRLRAECLEWHSTRNSFRKAHLKLGIYPSLDQRGSLQLPLILITLVTVLAGSQTWAFLRKERIKAEIQLCLDRWVSHSAILFQNHQNQIESANEKIRQIRALTPSAQTHTQLEELGQLQNQEISLWEKERTDEARSKLCSTWRQPHPPFPPLQWMRPPADERGLFALELLKPETQGFELVRRWEKLSAFAHVRKSDADQKWKAYWGPSPR